MKRLQGIRNEVERFHNATLASFEQLGIQFENYPAGSCGAASELLAEYLHSKGFGIFSYVSVGNNGSSHAWLEQDGLIIDITAGQFEGSSEAFRVTKETGWYEKFQERRSIPNGSYKHWGRQVPEAMK